jgi:hypothetical protein
MTAEEEEVVGSTEATQFEGLDKSEFGWLHVKAILVAGIGYTFGVLFFFLDLMIYKGSSAMHMTCSSLIWLFLCLDMFTTRVTKVYLSAQQDESFNALLMLYYQFQQQTKHY